MTEGLINIRSGKGGVDQIFTLKQSSEKTTIVAERACRIYDTQKRNMMDNGEIMACTVRVVNH